MGAPITPNNTAPIAAPWGRVGVKKHPRKEFFSVAEQPEVAAPTMAPAPAPIPMAIRVERPRREIWMVRISERWMTMSLPWVQVRESALTLLRVQLAWLVRALTLMEAPTGSAWTCCQLEPAGGCAGCWAVCWAEADSVVKARRAASILRIVGVLLRPIGLNLAVRGLKD